MQALQYALAIATAVCAVATLVFLTIDMRAYRFKFSLIATLLLGSIAAIIPPRDRLKLGIDLSGGTILVYQVKDTGRGDSSRMDDLINALKKRINPEGLQDIPIRKVGNNRIEIILAEATPEQVDQLKRKIVDVGALEFRILANERKDGARGSNAVARALAPGGLARPPKGYRWGRVGETITGAPTATGARTITDATRAWTIDKYANPRWTGSREDFARTHVTLTGKDSTGAERTSSFAIVNNSRDTLTLAKPHNFKSVTSYTIDYNPGGIEAGPDAIVRDEPAENGRVEKYILLKQDSQNVTGELLSHAYLTQDERVQPAVGFEFNTQGARRFGALTRAHMPEENGAFRYRLAIVLDGLVMSAPSINDEIRERGIIEGVQPKEVNYLIEILSSGSLPASIEPTPLLEENIGPTLGQDTIEKGLWAIGISMFVVPLFMLVYYRFAGLVAVLALMLNMLLLVASMALTNSSITLPGLAGLALTIGMAVDANVLIFERMREEAERGAGMAQQIRNGFSRAWTTILDSNVTTMLSGVVLFAVGTEEIRGFALTLILGLVWNLLTAVYISRVVFDFCYDRGRLKKLTMMKLFDRTNIDFIRPRRALMTGSVIVILIGLGIFAARGRRLYNIDFTGGTLVTIGLDEKAPALAGKSTAQRAAEVRNLASKALPDATVETLKVSRAAGGGVRYNIRTTNSNVEQVQTLILETFKDLLVRPEVRIASSERIPGEKPAAAATKDDAAKKSATPVVTNRFAGGTRYTLTFNRPLDPGTIETTLSDVLKAAGVTNPATHFAVETPANQTSQTVTALNVSTDLDKAEADKAIARLSTRLRNNPSLLFERLENFGGAVAGETRQLAVLAIVASWIAIIFYVWMRFKSVSYGFAAVIALVHDVLITMGAVALSPYKIDLPMIAAFLTLIGFSVNDTIVIFDRIREIKGKTPYLTGDMINAAVNQTLSRTILTSLTAWLVVVILYLFGGEGLAGFSFCLVVGFLSGTYSTIYIASPILIDWAGRRETVNVKTPTAMAAKA